MIHRIFPQGALLALVVAIMMAGCAAISEQVERVEEWGKGLQKNDEGKASSSKRPEEAKASSSKRSEEAKASSSKGPEEAKAFSSKGPEEAKGSSSKRPEEAKKTAFHVHTVKWPGESLPIISRWYAGSVDQWTRIAKANPSVDPKRIQVGMKIRVPKEIMTNTKTMPQDFVASFYPEPAKESDKPTPPAEPDEEEPTLIGPKSYSDR